jgi:hypothetical protein
MAYCRSRDVNLFRFLMPPCSLIGPRQCTELHISMTSRGGWSHRFVYPFRGRDTTRLRSLEFHVARIYDWLVSVSDAGVMETFSITDTSLHSAISSHPLK